MQEMTLSALTQEQTDKFWSDGVLVVEDAVSAKELADLKKVFKDSQKVECTNFEDSQLKSMTVSDFKAMGEQIKQAHPTQVTSFKEGDYDFHLWIPKNLYFIFCANYEEPILQSLIDKKGWSSTGERFTIQHFN